MASKSSNGPLSSHQGRKTKFEAPFLRGISSPITRKEDIRQAVCRRGSVLVVWLCLKPCPRLVEVFFCLGYQKGKELGEALKIASWHNGKGSLVVPSPKGKGTQFLPIILSGSNSRINTEIIRFILILFQISILLTERKNEINKQ